MNTTLARVVGVHPESNAVDIEMMIDNRRIPGVQVGSGSAGTDCGLADLSEPTFTEYGKGNSKTRDIYAVVTWVHDFPIVLCFLFPQVSECLFLEKNFRVNRHASDVYSTIDANGNIEVCHPSGAYVRFGATPDHVDLTGKDYDKKWKIKRNTDKPVHIHVGQAGGVASVNISPSGQIDAVSSVGFTVTSPSNVINGPLHVTENITTPGDVIAGTISQKHHTHPDPQGGSVGSPQ